MWGRGATRPIRGLVLAAFAPFLIGCSIHPLPDDVSRKSTYDIVDKIRCEAKAAVEQYGSGFGEASIVYKFLFNINEKNDASAGFTLFNPFKNGTFDLTASAGSNRIREGNREFDLIDSFDDLRKMDCSRDREVNWIYPLTGDVGMYNAVATFIRLQSPDNPGASRVVTFADTLTYTTTFSGELNAKLTLQQVPEEFRVTKANAVLSASRMDMHKVVVTMAAETQVVRDRSGKRFVRRTVPLVDAPIGGFNGGFGAGIADNTVLSTRLLQQESSAENRALYELDRQRQLGLQRRSNDVRVIVGP